MVRSPNPSPAATGALSLDTTSKLGPDTVGFRSSGQSPGRRTLHLVGPGAVGRRFLTGLAGSPFRVLAVTDSTATVFDREGLDLAAIGAHKVAGEPLATFAGAESVSTELAIELAAADFVVDATPSRPSDALAALGRVRAARRGGAFVALAGKNALALAAPELLLGSNRGTVGIQATLGGAGAQLVRELPELRVHCRGLALVGNVTTTVIIEAIENGASIDEGIAAADARGLLEPDRSLDLEGIDAATKLVAVQGAVFGERWLAAPDPVRVPRQSVYDLDPHEVRARSVRGATTRLVARRLASGQLRVAFEEVPVGSPLAAPADRVVYTYDLPAGLRVHTGLAVGYERTAAALREDCDAALRHCSEEVR
ncbi:MAG: hypothetical protein NXI31_20095 [bacterium]|nr:hypothetical protein [bacterium]